MFVVINTYFTLQIKEEFGISNLQLGKPKKMLLNMEFLLGKALGT